MPWGFFFLNSDSAEPLSILIYPTSPTLLDHGQLSLMRNRTSFVAKAGIEPATSRLKVGAAPFSFLAIQK